MKWRRIPEGDVVLAIEAPEDLEDSIEGRKNAYRTIDNRLLKVTYKVEEGLAVVVTAMIKGE